MSTKTPNKRLDKVTVAKAAWNLAYIQQATFTTEALAAHVRMSPNRHFREFVNQLAKDGLLRINRILCEDGHYRKFFYAHEPTDMLEVFKAKKEILS